MAAVKLIDLADFNLIVVSLPKKEKGMTSHDKWTYFEQKHIDSHTSLFANNKSSPSYQITVTQHNAKAPLWDVSTCKVSGGWSCKDVGSTHHFASLIWQGWLLPLTEESHHSIKLHANLEPILSNVPASQTRRIYLIIRAFGIYGTGEVSPISQWAPALISSQIHWLTPSVECSQSYIRYLF